MESRHGRDRAGDDELSSLSSRLAECGEEGFRVMSAAPRSTEHWQSSPALILVAYGACDSITASASYSYTTYMMLLGVTVNVTL